jgi:hypothetical protein
VKDVFRINLKIISSKRVFRRGKKNQRGVRNVREFETIDFPRKVFEYNGVRFFIVKIILTHPDCHSKLNEKYLTSSIFSLFLLAQTAYCLDSERISEM